MEEAFAKLPPALRIDRTIPSPRARFKAWVKFPAGIAVLKRMAALIDRESEGRPLGLAISAGSSFGKSHLLDHFRDCYPDIEGDDARIQILYAETPPRADGAALLRSLLAALGAAVNPGVAPDILLDKLVVRAQAARVLIVLIDEVTNANWGRRDAAVTFVQTIRSVCNRLGRPVVLAGTNTLGDLLRHDVQLNERFAKVTLPEWKSDTDVADFIATFETNPELQGVTGFRTSDHLALITSKADGKLGRIARIVRESAKLVRAEGSRKVERRHLDAAIEICAGAS